MNTFIQTFIQEEQLRTAENKDLQERHKALAESDSLVSFSAFSREGSGDQVAVLLHSPLANAGETVHYHSHDCFELIYVVSGFFTQLFPDHRRVFPEGSFCLLNTHIRHAVQTSSPDDIILNILIDKGFLSDSLSPLFAESKTLSGFFLKSTYGDNREQYLSFFPDQYLPGSDEPAPVRPAEEPLGQLIREYALHRPGSTVALKAWLMLLFVELFRFYTAETSEVTGYDILFAEILKTVSDHPDQVSLTGFAEQYHYHPAYLSRLFKTYLKKNFRDIVNDVRFQKAVSYLEDSDLSINDIAARLGFYDRSYFNREFRKRFGESPGSYRAARKKTGSDSLPLQSGPGPESPESPV